jgi:hypothetical protein
MPRSKSSLHLDIAENLPMQLAKEINTDENIYKIFSDETRLKTLFANLKIMYSDAAKKKKYIKIIKKVMAEPAFLGKSLTFDGVTVYFFTSGLKKCVNFVL